MSTLKIIRKMIKTKIIENMDYSDKNLNLFELNKIELKNVLKHYRLHISGNKSVLINRIQQYLIKNENIVILQKVLRGYFVRKSFKIRGIAFKNRTICTNESDFYTLEPLNEIPFELFFSYTDEKNFTYGFDITSLVLLYFKMGKIINPYNRNKLPLEIMLDIFSLYGMIKICFKEHVAENSSIRIPNAHHFRVHNTQPVENTMMEITSDRRHQENVNTTMEITFDRRILNINRNILYLLPIDQHTQSDAVEMIETLSRIKRSIEEIRMLSIDRRVEEIFMEIDRLGFYTHSTWFTNLSEYDLFRFYNNLRELWDFRGRIIPIEKERISPFGDPFTLANTITSRVGGDINILNLITTVIEYLILSAPDIENRKIGILQVLRALTTVSGPARTELFYLYESVVW